MGPSTRIRSICRALPDLRKGWRMLFLDCSTSLHKRSESLHDRLPQTPHRSRSADQTHLGACAAGEVDSTWAHFDVAHLVGEATIGGLSCCDLRRALARPCGSELSRRIS